MKNIVIICFGTPTINGDSLGPLVGSALKDRLDCFVYGTVDNPVTGKNMQEYIDLINSAHADDVVLAVDATLGREDRIGKITIRTDGVCPSAVTGNKKRFGDVGVLGVVAPNEGDHIKALSAVNDVYVRKMADKVADMIQKAIILYYQIAV